MPLELFLDMLSQPCRSVYIFAKKNKIPVEVRMVSLMNADHFTEEYGKVNPLRKVPGLRDGDFSMGESVAMMEYMAQKYNTPEHWYPAELLKRARVNEYLCWQHLGMRMPGTKLFWMKVVAPVFKLEVPEENMARVLLDLETALDQMENKFIQDGGFIGGDHISIADLQAIVEIMQPFSVGHKVFEGRPRLSAWKERVVEALGKELFDEAHDKLFKAKEQIKDFDPSNMQMFMPKVLKMIS